MGGGYVDDKRGRAADRQLSDRAARSGHDVRPRPGRLAEPARRRRLDSGCRGLVVAHGVSANRYLQADLEATTSTLGYRPVDDAWALDTPFRPKHQ